MNRQSQVGLGIFSFDWGNISYSNADNEGNYLERFKDRQASAPSGSTFHGQDGDVHMVGSMFDIFAAGTDTTSTFLEWSIHYMICYPDVQVDKI